MNFRSKTEECWDYIFKALGLPYFYEPASRETRHGDYWPDFYFPDVKRYFEIKGGPPTKPEIEKAFDFRKQSGEAIYFLNQIPTQSFHGFGLWRVKGFIEDVELMNPCPQCLMILLGIPRQEIGKAICKARHAVSDFRTVETKTLDKAMFEAVDKLTRWHPRSFKFNPNEEQ